jgi:hypothetical protein
MPWLCVFLHANGPPEEISIEDTLETAMKFPSNGAIVFGYGSGDQIRQVVEQSRRQLAFRSKPGMKSIIKSGTAMFVRLKCPATAFRYSFIA